MKLFLSEAVRLVEKYPDVKPYIQHGFRPTDEVGDNNIVGDCPFCGRERKFYVNKNTKAWDCKVCQRKGGFQTFLAEVYACSNVADDNVYRQAIARLAVSRGISGETLQFYGIGWNNVTENWTLPVFDVNGKTLIDVRRYSNGKLLSTATCKTGLWNIHNLAKCEGTVWLCEGEWDGLVMSEILTKLNRVNDVAVAVPGAEVFKPTWIFALQNKKVVCLYDHDRAGKNGTVKVFNLIKSVVSELKFLHWEADKGEGYDIRDLYKDNNGNAANTLKYIEAHLKDEPTGAVTVETQSTQSTVIVYDGKGLDADIVRDAYLKWYHIPDPSVIDVLYGAILANRLQGDPLWMFLVAAPGMTKTEFLQSFRDAKGIESVSTLTPHALVSGATAMGGVDPSLIPHLNGKVLIVKDFTTILAMNKQFRDDVFGTLRDAYDGEITKIFGTGLIRHYISKFGIIAGVTPAIDTYLEGESALGERFLRYNIQFPCSLTNRRAYCRKSMDNMGLEDNMRAEIRTIASEALNYDFPKDVHIPDDIEDKLIDLSVWIATMRGTVMRDYYTKEIVAKPYVEIGTRLAKQLMKLLVGIGMFRRVPIVGEDEFAIVKQVAKSTVPEKTGLYTEAIYSNCKEKPFTVSEVSEMVRLPSSTVQRALEGMYQLGIIERAETQISIKSAWKLSPELLTVLDKVEIYR